MSKLINIYNRMNKAKNHFEKITTFDNFIKFFEIEKELYNELNKLNLDGNRWIEYDDKINICVYCNYKLNYTNDKKKLNYKKLIHQFITCEHNNHNNNFDG